jgi:hypothetical protein
MYICITFKRIQTIFVIVKDYRHGHDLPRVDNVIKMLDYITNKNVLKLKSTFP